MWLGRWNICTCTIQMNGLVNLLIANYIPVSDWQLNT